MPKFLRPIVLDCSTQDGEQRGRCRVYMDSDMTTRSRDFVKEFLGRAGNSQWRLEQLTSLERVECGLPADARIVSFPAHQKDWFYQVFDREFVVPYQMEVPQAPLVLAST